MTQPVDQPYADAQIGNASGASSSRYMSDICRFDPDSDFNQSTASRTRWAAKNHPMSTDRTLYSGTWRWVKPLTWAEGTPIMLYWTAAVQGPSSLWAEFTVSPHVLRKRTP